MRFHALPAGFTFAYAHHVEPPLSQTAVSMPCVGLFVRIGMADSYFRFAVGFPCPLSGASRSNKDPSVIPTNPNHTPFPCPLAGLFVRIVNLKDKRPENVSCEFPCPHVGPCVRMQLADDGMLFGFPCPRVGLFVGTVPVRRGPALGDAVSMPFRRASRCNYQEFDTVDIRDFVSMPFRRAPVVTLRRFCRL